MSKACNGADLTNCDRGAHLQRAAIQPFGFLLTVSADWRIVRASANLEQFLGVGCEQVLRQPLSGIIMSRTLHSIRNRLTVIRGPVMIERLSGIAFAEGGPIFDVALHCIEGGIVIEAEPSQREGQGGSTLSMAAMMARIDQAQTLEAFFRESARQARGITGFDRVMVYRFDDEGSGEIVAEAARSGIGSLLGLHFPATDIAAEERAFYARNLFRITADVDAAPVPVVPELDAHGRAIDLSLSLLRVAPSAHIDHLKDLGVGASFSVPIVVDGRLWGLFACHHYAARLLPVERRLTAELFAQMFASRLQTRECRLALEFETGARKVVERLLAAVADNIGLPDDPALLAEVLAGAVPADGIGVWIDGRTALSGLAPSQQQFSALIDTLNRKVSGHVFATDRVAELWPEAELNGDVAGLMGISTSQPPRDYIVFFRQEMLRTVHWAGGSPGPAEHDADSHALTFHKSFQAWSDLMRGRSLPFSAAQRHVAETIGVALQAISRLTG
ncbi:PAS and GAF and phytochrome domain-containing protein [Rhizobium gallicum bv. gallicum R602sp]|uniref:PAS and GAF and phytochrome domain-containing protein n=1 Tax=Rhizobium gallicum bv. gallicum R602sp TaxID=1041138 RepID=A0A0B4X2E8_9HYPH|nr:GAF domain-containing protein [Rhizobium gallicum]AJD42209.1 PAS and GAF and phytochrome domain-containing protein [Rhizobium gallicum bv. gallicum R602sp]